MNGNKFLTVPAAEDNYRPYHLTGNEYVSLPLIDPATGAVECVNVLSMQAVGLLEFYGSADQPLLRPFLLVDESPVDLHGNLGWECRGEWIPAFTVQHPQCRLSGEILAPPGLKGFCYHLVLTNTSSHALTVSLGWAGEWAETRQTVFTSRPIAGNTLYYSSWTKSLVLECRPGLAVAALALGTEDPNISISHQPGTPGEGAIRFTFWQDCVIAPGDTKELTLITAANAEGDGAATTLVHLRRLGWRSLRSSTEEWLAVRQLTTGDPALDRLLNKNLLFNHFFATGNTIDTEECTPVTSRSPRYYVSGAFWPRDTFLWSFPALLLTDRERARQVLLAGYRRHLKNPGQHAQYINGSLLYPGFELDQLAAFVLALDGYLAAGGNPDVLEEPEIPQGLRLILAELDRHRHPATGLYDTFLDPADDPVTYPFLIYDQVLAWRALTILHRLNHAQNLWPARNLAMEAQALKEAILLHGIVEGPFGRMFAWAVDGKGRYELYDSPPGSLMLLAHYGLCPPDDPVFQNTLRWIHSEANPYHGPQAPFAGPGCTHAPGPWVLGLTAALLAGMDAPSREIFQKAPMDSGLACETLDPATGVARTGLAFATCAGFLAYAIYRRWGRPAEPNQQL
ncbi:MAG: glycoside hydrolase family 125 protein [Bacillota bacterium]